MKKIIWSVVMIIVSLFAYAQNNYNNIAIARVYENGNMMSETQAYTNVTISQNDDTLYWEVNNEYRGQFPITNIEMKQDKVVYHYNPNGYKEMATFEVFNEVNERGDVYCRLRMRKKNGYVQFLFGV